MKNIKKIISGALLSVTLLGSGLTTSSMACPFDQKQNLQDQIEAANKAQQNAYKEKTSSAWFEAENRFKEVVHTVTNTNDPNLASLKDQFYKQANDAKIQASLARVKENQNAIQNVEDVSITTITENSSTNLSQKTSPIFKIEK